MEGMTTPGKGGFGQAEHQSAFNPVIIVLRPRKDYDFRAGGCGESVIEPQTSSIDSAGIEAQIRPRYKKMIPTVRVAADG